jgi:hypothetical protein
MDEHFWFAMRTFGYIALVGIVVVAAATVVTVWGSLPTEDDSDE